MQEYFDAYAIHKDFIYTNPYAFLQTENLKPIKGKRVEVRIEPKIQRNEVCPKCQSGFKFKRCCGRLNAY